MFRQTAGILPGLDRVLQFTPRLNHVLPTGLVKTCFTGVFANPATFIFKIALIVINKHVSNVAYYLAHSSMEHNQPEVWTSWKQLLTQQTDPAPGNSGSDKPKLQHDGSMTDPP
jgi:hypothetical protein